MIRAAGQSTAALRGVLHWTAALVIFFNAVALGFATGAMAHVGVGGVLAVVCGSTDSQAQGGSDYKTPAKEGHCVACAIIYSSSATETALAATPAKASPNVAPPILRIPIFNSDAIHAAPELRSISSRAPPSRNV